MMNPFKAVSANKLSLILIVVSFLLMLANADAKEFRDDRLIVKPRADLAAKQKGDLRAVHSAIGARVHRTYPRLRGIQVIELPRGLGVEKALKHYRESGLFEYVEPDYEVHALVTPNDPYFLNNLLYGLPKINAPAAWDVRTDASNIIVAVIDTGVDYTHPDLSANIWVNPGEIAGNGIDDDGDGFVDDVHGINAITGSGDPKDDHFHGTHTAGTIGAAGNNGIGVVGVAWHVQIMACKFLDANGSGFDSDAIECINYAMSKGAHIMSNSWGCQGCFDLALQDAIGAAGAQGIIFVAAAGNSAQNIDATPFYPAGYTNDNLVAVAATDSNDQLAGFSNYGNDGVDLAAPGVGIWSTFPSYPTGAITNGGYSTDYFAISGTSMATPHVAGALAVVKAQFPSDTYVQLIYRVLGNTDALPSLAGKCVTQGRLNLYNALTQTPGPIARLTATPTSGEPPLTVSFSNTSLGTITNLVWDFGDGSQVTNAGNPTHVYGSLGSYTATLTVYGIGGVRSASRTIVVAENYQMQPAAFSWVDPSAMALRPLTDDSVTDARPLPFPFVFYGQTNTTLYIGSNGLLGFTNVSLFLFVNADMPSPALPNNIICPYWDDLNPGTNGEVRIGTIGSAPNRAVVVSWVGVPHWPFFTPTYTFQVLLHETSNDITFQYLEVQPMDLNSGQGRSATVGIESATGLVARRYSYNGSSLLTNSQAILFTPTKSGYPPFIMDGSVDFTNYLQRSSGMTLYAAVRGTTLYVATWSPGNDTGGANDHFLFATDQILPAASAAAPWAKFGQVAVDPSKPFLAGESQNEFVGWFMNGSATGLSAVKAPTNSGWMEGTLDMVSAFGAVPDVIYFCAAAYGTPDGGLLVSQTPAGDANLNIESNEFLAIPVVALLDNNGDGIYDRLDPALNFRITSVEPVAGGYEIRWSALPLHAYQVQSCSNLSSAPWTDVGSLMTAGVGEVSLVTTNHVPIDGCFYRVKLMP